MARHRVNPATFFLNETHELSPAEKAGGGRLAQYAPISWTQKAAKISDSLETVREAVESSNDPLKDHRYFAMALPEPKVKKTSQDKKKAPSGTVEEETEFAERHGRVFERLGLDLLQVTPDGKAIVHADRDKFEQLARRSESLDTLGAREQARWITIDSFEIVQRYPVNIIKGRANVCWWSADGRAPRTQLHRCARKFWSREDSVSAQLLGEEFGTQVDGRAHEGAARVR